MGVTVHCFALDSTRYDGQHLHIDGLLERGIVDKSLEVTPEHQASFCALETHMGENKKWYLNFQADEVYLEARTQLSEASREPIDTLLGHLFWGIPWSENGPRSPRKVGDMTWLYPAELVDRILSLSQTDLSPLLNALPGVQADEPDRHTDLLWGPEMFKWWVELWLQLFRDTRAKGPNWALLMWVWV